MSKNDPIREIDMRQPENKRRAIEIALAASDPEGWCTQATEELYTLGRESPTLWTVYNDQHNPEGHAVIAITGNGEKSEANAEFFVNARPIVLGLISEIDRLETVHRNLSARALAEILEWLRTDETVHRYSNTQDIAEALERGEHKKKRE